MNGCQSSTESYSECQYYLQRVSDFHAVLLGMAAHDLRQPLQVIQSTYEWLSGRFDDDVNPSSGFGWMCRLVDSGVLLAAGFYRARKPLIPIEET